MKIKATVVLECKRCDEKADVPDVTLELETEHSSCCSSETTFNVYEDLPEGWTGSWDYAKCPDCSEKYAESLRQIEADYGFERRIKADRESKRRNAEYDARAMREQYVQHNGQWIRREVKETI